MKRRNRDEDDVDAYADFAHRHCIHMALLSTIDAPGLMSLNHIDRK